MFDQALSVHKLRDLTEAEIAEVSGAYATKAEAAAASKAYASGFGMGSDVGEIDDLVGWVVLDEGGSGPWKVYKQDTIFAPDVGYGS